MVWYSHLFQNFPQYIVIHTEKGFITLGYSKFYCLFTFTTVIQVYAPTTNTEEAEVEQFYEDLQDFHVSYYK